MFYPIDQVSMIIYVTPFFEVGGWLIECYVNVV